MELSRPPLVVAFELSEKRKAIVADALAGASAVVYGFVDGGCENRVNA
jgi:hypothetical protein